MDVTCLLFYLNSFSSLLNYVIDVMIKFEIYLLFTIFFVSLLPRG